jgi:hypothetical protein
MLRKNTIFALFKNKWGDELKCQILIILPLNLNLSHYFANESIIET